MKPSQRIREIARARLVAVCKRKKTAPVDEDWIDFALEIHGPSSVDVMAFLDEQHAAGLALDRVVEEVKEDSER